jgi:hypothetical protein
MQGSLDSFFGGKTSNQLKFSILGSSKKRTAEQANIESAGNSKITKSRAIVSYLFDL